MPGRATQGQMNSRGLWEAGSVVAGEWGAPRFRRRV